VIDTLAVSLGRFGSFSVSALFEAVLVTTPVAVTLAVRVRVAEAPLAMLPIVQTPVALS